MTAASPLLITIFVTVVVTMLAIDLGIFHRKAHAVRFGEALVWTLVWVSLSMGFAALTWKWYGQQKALEFLSGYVIEEALSVDNIFVFVVIFAAFRVAPEFQHRVLFWGIFGAVVMRGIFIGLGTALVQRFQWILYGFGALLVVTAIKLVMSGEEAPHPEKNPIFRFITKFIPVVPQYHGQAFTVVQEGKRYFTPLAVVLVAVESSDLVFAVDSIPAVFAVSTDPFIVYTSNIFAILGLRSMYFLLAGVVDKFFYLRYGLAAVLAFVGFKMLVHGYYKIPIGLSLSIIAGLLTISIAASALRATQVTPSQP